MKPSLLLTAALLTGLGACGKMGPLERTKEMGPLPVAVGASRPATAAELVQPSTQVRPARNGDVLGRSERRPVDGFDKRPDDQNGRYPAPQD